MCGERVPEMGLIQTEAELRGYMRSQAATWDILRNPDFRLS